MSSRVLVGGALPKEVGNGHTGIMRAPDTVTEALAELREAGYTENMQLLDGHILWDDRCQTCAAEKIEVDRVYRFEGTSDPGDEMIVFGLTDPETGTKGALASAYGINADPAIFDILTGLETRFAKRWGSRGEG